MVEFLVSFYLRDKKKKKEKRVGKPVKEEKDIKRSHGWPKN